MAWVAVDKDESEYIYYEKPLKVYAMFYSENDKYYIELPKGSIFKLIGKELTFDNEPVEL